MCGQLGYSGKDNFDVDKIKLLLTYNSLERGEDATGLYSPKNNVIKSLDRGVDFIVKNFDTLIPDTMLMCHARSKTIGRHNIDDAHPFHRGNCILQHNGTLKNYYALSKKYNLDWSKYWVDSDVICGCIDTNKNFNVLSEIDGPAAIIATNTNDPYTIYVFRNSERPLYKGFYNGNMYISSIKESLEIINCINIKEFESDILYTIKDGSVIKKVKIVNTPYFEKFNNNFNNNDKDNDLKKYVGSVLRATYTTQYGNTFNLKTNNYYKIVGFIKPTMLKVQMDFNDEDKVESFILSYFDIDSYIKAKDYVISLFDIELNGKTIIKANEMFEAGKETKDNSSVIQVCDKDNDKVLCFAKREYFRKAADSEILSYYNTPINNIPNNNIKENTEFINESDESIDDSPNFVLLDDLTEENFNEKLDDHFTCMDNGLEILLNKVDKVSIDPDIKLLIISLLDANTIAQNAFIREEENAT